MTDHGKYQKLVEAAASCIVGWDAQTAPVWVRNLAVGLAAAGCPVEEICPGLLPEASDG